MKTISMLWHVAVTSSCFLHVAEGVLRTSIPPKSIRRKLQNSPIPFGRDFYAELRTDCKKSGRTEEPKVRSRRKCHNFPKNALRARTLGSQIPESEPPKGTSLPELI